MGSVALAFVLLTSLASIARLVTVMRRDVFGPLVFWYAALLVLLYSRLIVILTQDHDYRWIGYLLPDQVAMSAILLCLLAIAATLAVELGISMGLRRAPPAKGQITYSFPLASLTFLIGALAFGIFYYLIGGISSAVDKLAESKSASGTGVILMFAALIWVAPLMALTGAKEKRLQSIPAGAIFLLLAAISVASLYGRATPLLWGILMFLFASHYLGNGVRIGRFALGAIVLGVLMVGYKAYRLSVSWGVELGTFWELIKFYLSTVVVDGGEQAITDMSLRLLASGGQDFPIGSFWERWIMWPIELLPSFLFPFEFESPTVGRQMYWWGTGRFDLDSGVPVFGFVAAFKTGSIGLLLAVYWALGFVVGRAYTGARSKSSSAILGYLFALCLLLFFTRIGDFSASLVQVIVLAGIPWLYLQLLQALFGSWVPYQEDRGLAAS